MEMNYPSEEQITTLCYECQGLTVNGVINNVIKLMEQINPEPAKPEFDWPEEWVCACKDSNGNWAWYKMDDTFGVDLVEWFGYNWKQIIDRELSQYLNQLTIGKPWTECKILRSEVMK